MFLKKQSRIGLVSFFASLGGVVQLILCVLGGAAIQTRAIMSGDINAETGVLGVFVVLTSIVAWIILSTIGFFSGVIGLIKKDKSRGLLIGGVALSMVLIPVLLFFGVLATTLGR